MDVEKKTFIWQSTLLSTLTYYRRCLLRFPRRVQLLHARSAFSGKANPIAQDKIESHLTNLITISPEGTYTLADELGAAITHAKESLAKEMERRKAIRARRRR